MHKEIINSVPNALPSRNNIEIEIYGMEGIPEGDRIAHDRIKNGGESVCTSVFKCNISMYMYMYSAYMYMCACD